MTFSDSAEVPDGTALVALLRGHDRAIVGLERIDDAILSQLPELTVISKYGVGLDGLDIDAIRRRGIKLGWTGGVNRRSRSSAIRVIRARAAAGRAIASTTRRGTP